MFNSKTRMICTALLFIFFLLGCIATEEDTPEQPSEEAPAGEAVPPAEEASAESPADTIEPAQEQECTISEQYCAYDSVSKSLKCGSNYAIVSQGQEYWREKCQEFSIEPNHLISLTGPFESYEEYQEFLAEGEETLAEWINESASDENVTIEDLQEALDAALFKGRPHDSYIYFLYSKDGTYPINNETSTWAVAEKFAESMGD